MANFRVAYLFEGAGYGWTEVFYDVRNSIDDYTGIGPEEIQAVLSPRGDGVKLQAVKVTEEGSLRRSKIFRVNAVAQRTALIIGQEVAGVAAKVRLNFAGGGGRTLNVRGLAGFTTEDVEIGTPGLSASGRALLDSYIAWITSPSDPYNGKQLASIGQEPWKDVVSIQADETNGDWTRVNIVDTGLVLTAGNLVYFKGVDKTQLPWLRGIYRVVGTLSATRFSIPTKYREPVATTTLRNVQYRRAIYTYPALTGGNFVRFGIRDTRLPFERVRGSRPALRTR